MSKINIYTNNSLQLQGRVGSVKEYAAGKAANISIAIEGGKDKDGGQKETQYIQLKSFTPASYNTVKVGMKVRVYGHVSPNKYEKNGETVQTGFTKDMVFSVDKIIAYCSKFFTLKTGDLIFTGTPVGVGPVKENDILEGFIGEKKVLRQKIK